MYDKKRSDGETQTYPYEEEGILTSGNRHITGDRDVFGNEEGHSIKYKTLSWQLVAVLMIAEIVSNGMLSLPSSGGVVGVRHLPQNRATEVSNNFSTAYSQCHPHRGTYDSCYNEIECSDTVHSSWGYSALSQHTCSCNCECNILPQVLLLSFSPTTKERQFVQCSEAQSSEGLATQSPCVGRVFGRFQMSSLKANASRR